MREKRGGGAFLILEVISPVGAFLLALAMGAVVILFMAENPLHIYTVMFRGGLGSIDGFGYVLFSATPLIFTGLAVAFAFRGGLFNIGGEGQLYMGTFFCAWIGFSLVGMPPVLMVPICISAAALGGALWGFMPGILKARFGVHEVINTIMLNFVAMLATNFLVNHVYKEPGQMIPQTNEIASTAWIPRMAPLLQRLHIQLPRSNPLNYSLLFALAVAALAWFILFKTRLGYEIRAVGLSQKAAEYGGIKVGTTVVLSMVISGAMAGLVGVNEVMGYRHRFLDGFSTGLGFTGIAVALLGRNHPLGVVLAAVLFGILNTGALEVDIFTDIPRELVMVLQAVIIICVVVGDQVFRRWMGRRMK
jgi:simple sugar transport system permease protein